MSTQRRRRIAGLLKLCGAAGLDPAAVEPAFVHESATNEGAGPSNERLEFLGDSILGFVTARWLCARYPDANEGELHRRRAALVSGDACAQTATRLGFGLLVTVGAGMRTPGGVANTTILADAFEAFIAGLYLHTDLERVARFLEHQHLEPLDHPEVAQSDAKSSLQELAQHYYGLTPLYFDRAEGPPQDRRFTSQVRVGDEVVGEGIGASKKAAQQSAAAMALALLQQRRPEPPEPPGPAAASGAQVIALRPSRNRTKAPK